MSTFDIAKQVPEFSIFTAGYVVRDVSHQQKIFEGPIGQDMFDKVSDKMGLKVLSTIYLGTRQLALREARSVKTPADLKGVKLRMPASKEWLFLGNALGATATPLAFGEVYLGLKSGTIDAQENPLSTLKATKLYEVTQQVVLTNHLVDALFITIANQRWKSFNPTQQKALLQAAQAARDYNNEHRLAEERELTTFLKKQGLQITTPDVAAFRQAVQKAYQDSAYASQWPQGLLTRINDIH
jgi:tripartite ATP-independent transporter DctP family solute receptor